MHYQFDPAPTASYFVQAMHRNRFILLLTALLLTNGPAIYPQASPYSGPAPHMPGGDRGAFDDDNEVSIRFSPFLRAHQETPEEQLIYARDLMEQGNSRKARSQFRALLKKWPASREAALAEYHFAVLTQQRGKLTKAAREYEYLLQTYAGGFPHEEVLQRLDAIGIEFVNNKKAKFLFGGFAAPERALPVYETIVTYGPEWEGASRAQYTIGLIHQDLRQYEYAVPAYERTRTHYPDTPWAVKAAFGQAECRYLLSREQPNDYEALHNAWIDLTVFVQTYPEAADVAQAELYRDRLLRRWAQNTFQQAEFYERVTRRPQAALRAYREFVKKFPSSEWTPQARERIQALAASLDEQAPETETDPTLEDNDQETPASERLTVDERGIAE